MNEPSFLRVSSIDTDVEEYLAGQGEVFRTFGGYDSGCTGYGVKAEGRRWFFKHGWHERALVGLERAAAIHRVVEHPSLAPLRNRFATSDGVVLVYDWANGEWLRDPQVMRCFAALPLEEAIRAVETILDLHAVLAERGFVAVDLYDGSFIYDFNANKMYVCDLDEYRTGPFTMNMERLPGSTRFMAPEEWQRGSTIDQRTNVFTLGRVAAILLGDHKGSAERFRAGPTLWGVVEHATQTDRQRRFGSVPELLAAWNKAKTASGDGYARQ